MPRTRLAVAGPLAIVLCALVGCSNPAAPDGVRVDPIQIDQVEVQVLETAPPQARARVRGVIGDGCSTLKSVTQARMGQTVTLLILRERPVDAICTQLAKLYDETIALEGTYPAGRYLLRVNGLEQAFETR
jgi:acetolactate synthase regulatory subunit